MGAVPAAAQGDPRRGAPTAPGRRRAAGGSAPEPGRHALDGCGLRLTGASATWPRPPVLALYRAASEAESRDSTVPASSGSTATPMLRPGGPPGSESIEATAVRSASVARRAPRRSTRSNMTNSSLPAQAGSDGLLVGHRTHRVRHRLQGLVTGRVTPGVVDRLEVVQVDGQHSERVSGAGRPATRRDERRVE